MKQKYKKTEGYWYNAKWYEPYKAGTYGMVWSLWFRYPKTFNEIRQNSYAEEDGHKVRGRRKNIPTCYDDKACSQIYGRDWKRFTKRKKQWKV